MNCEHCNEAPAEVIKLEATYSWDAEGVESITPVQVRSCRPCAEYLYDGTEEFPGHTEILEDGQ